MLSAVIRKLLSSSQYLDLQRLKIHPFSLSFPRLYRPKMPAQRLWSFRTPIVGSFIRSTNDVKPRMSITSHKFTFLTHGLISWVFVSMQFRLCRPDCKPEGPLFSAEFVCLCVCLSVSDRHFYPSTLTDFDETWSQRLYCDLVWPRP